MADERPRNLATHSVDVQIGRRAFNGSSWHAKAAGQVGNRRAEGYSGSMIGSSEEPAGEARGWEASSVPGPRWHRVVRRGRGAAEEYQPQTVLYLGDDDCRRLLWIDPTTPPRRCRDSSADWFNSGLISYGSW